MTPPLLSTNSRATIEQLDAAIADIAAGIHASIYQLLVLLHEFDERKGWTNGFLSCAHWLSWRTGIDMGAAREKVRVARLLPDLPLLGAALQRGEVSYAKVRALTRIATPETEERLLAIAHHGTASQVERLVRAWRWCDRREDDRKHLWRSVSCHVDEDGMVVLRARLTAEQGAVVQRALEAASDRLYQESQRATAPDRLAEEINYEQRRADALVLMAEVALTADLDRGSAGDRYQVVLHVETAVTPLGLEAPPGLELADGPISVSAETSRRLSCDASVVIVTEDRNGSVLDVGRKTRTNLLLVCRRHHRLLHEGGFSVERTDEGAVMFRRPDGRRVEVAPPLTWSGRSVVPTGVSGRSLRTWDGTPFNVAYAIDLLHPHANPSSRTGL